MDDFMPLPASGDGVSVAAALAYAAAGYPVFPCGADKKPRIAKWPTDASSDPDQIRAWWQTWPDAMIGLVTGSRSGLYVVDIDVGGEKDGMAAYRELGLPLAEVGVRTPSGGGHAYFRWPGGGWGNSAGRIAPGVDTRGQGGYVIAPPSSNPAGEYRWVLPEMQERLLRGELPPLPDKLRSLLERPAVPVVARPATATADRSAWSSAALEGELSNLLAAPQGERNHALNRAAFRLGQIVAEGQLDQAEVEADLVNAARAIGLSDSEAVPTIRSGLAGGAKSPRGPRESSPAEAGECPPPKMSLLSTVRDAPPPFPGSRVFGDVWSGWMVDAARTASAPPDYIAAALLTAVSAAIGNSCWARAWEGFEQPPIIWAMIIGNPSAGKSPAMKAAMAPLRAIERAARMEAEAAHSRWREERELFEAGLARWRKSGGAGMSRPSDPPEEPHVPQLFVNDATVEKLGQILANQPRGCLMLRDEISGWMKSMNQYKSGGSDRQFWLECYDGGPFRVDRLSRDSIDIDRLSVGVLGGIQPDPLATLLMGLQQEDGLLARFLVVWPDLPRVRRPERALDVRMVERALSRLYGLPMMEGPDGKPAPRMVPLSDAASSKLEKYADGVRSSESELNGLLKSFAGKTPGMALRLALILALMEWSIGDEDDLPEVIEASFMEKALFLVSDYFFKMAKRAYAEAATPPEERAARLIGRAIVERRLTQVTLSDVREMKLDGVRKADQIQAALRVLVDGNILSEMEVKTGGRPRVVYAVNPACCAGTA
jgi:hypothetical protein